MREGGGVSEISDRKLILDSIERYIYQIYIKYMLNSPSGSLARVEVIFIRQDSLRRVSKFACKLLAFW